jgi:dienelactone hydrolase
LRRLARALAAATLLLAAPSPATTLRPDTTARTTEQVLQVPVHLASADGPALDAAMTVTVIRRADTRPRPFLVLQHGRPPTGEGRAALGRQSYPGNARYFAALGFVVLVPTRIGYGITGGPDLEFTGDCADKHFADGVRAGVAETRQLVDYAARLDYVDARHGLVVGESFGGLIAVAAASADIPGVVAAVNVAGGDGGDSLHHVDEPCRPDQLVRTLADLGAANRRPTLWLYSANDRFWGPRYPRLWYEAFRRAGGRGEFVELPADKNNGHFIFNRNPAAWHPTFEALLARLRLPGLRP